ncbi:MAG: hypothetical protein Q9M22_04545 [Mariprofundaceae bacterium]|nr:hypothetical protein [Mariprofundaceae bacterium]
MNECKHAHKVVCQFKSLLDPAAIKAVGDTHFEELALIIESAIGASTLEAIRHAAEISEKAAKDIVHIIERY